MIRLRKLREENGLSQVELSEKLGVVASAISNWENETRQMDYDILRQLSKIFNVSIDFILGNDFDIKILDEEERNMIGLYRSLPDNHKIFFVGMINLIKNMMR